MKRGVCGREMRFGHILAVGVEGLMADFWVFASPTNYYLFRIREDLFFPTSSFQKKICSSRRSTLSRDFALLSDNVPSTCLVVSSSVITLSVSSNIISVRSSTTPVPRPGGKSSFETSEVANLLRSGATSNITWGSESLVKWDDVMASIRTLKSNNENVFPGLGRSYIAESSSS